MQASRMTTDPVERSPNVELWVGVCINLSTAGVWRSEALQRTDEAGNLAESR